MHPSIVDPSSLRKLGLVTKKFGSYHYRYPYLADQNITQYNTTVQAGFTLRQHGLEFYEAWYENIMI